MEVKIFKCKECGKLITSLYGENEDCCKGNLELVVPNTVDAAAEKHVPVVNVDGTNVLVEIGSVPHPMEEEHHIVFIVLVTTNGYQIKYLNPTGKPSAYFKITEDEKVLKAIEFCNIHGLWEHNL